MEDKYNVNESSLELGTENFNWALNNLFQKN